MATDHRSQAEELLARAEKLTPTNPGKAHALAQANTHATLALADTIAEAVAPKAKPAAKRPAKKAEPKVEADVVPGSEEDVIRRESEASE